MGYSDEASEVITARKAATENQTFPVAAKKGISVCAVPADRTRPSTAREQSRTIAADSAAERPLCFISLPASMRTGVIRKQFSPAYSAPPAKPPRKESGKGAAFASTKMTRKGTSAQFRAEIPFVPLRRAATENASPNKERSGLKDGSRESSPANMAAEGMNAQKSTAAPIAGAAPLNTARSAPRYPPYFFPSERKRSTMSANTAAESREAAKKPSVPKKRTSSAPVTKPAPIAPPTMKNAPRKIPIRTILCRLCVKYY